MNQKQLDDATNQIWLGLKLDNNQWNRPNRFVNSDVNNHHFGFLAPELVIEQVLMMAYKLGYVNEIQMLGNV